MPVPAYRQAGVDYDILDSAKRKASSAAAGTSAALVRRGAAAVDASRGEPAFVWSIDDRYHALVIECLGTKSLIAGEHLAQNGVDRFDAVAYDTVAAAVNDLVCVGALPHVVNAYFAAGSAQWFAGSAAASIVEGWRRACDDAGATWGGGESPALAGVVAADAVDLAAAAAGVVPAGHSPLLGDDLAPGDEIVVVASSGMHANGASLARRVAQTLPQRWATLVRDGRSLGDAVLTPSAIYAEFVGALFAAAIPVRYLSNITGHGVLKVMRARAELTYVLHHLPPVPAELAMLAELAGLTAREAYTVFNMGLGFCVYCAPGAAGSVVAAAGECGFQAWDAGRVVAGPRRVVVEPLKTEFDGSEIALRAPGS